MDISKKTKNNKNKGFTLIEIMVSVSIFLFIMTMAMGSIMSVLSANRKSQTLRSVMDNLNLSLESMTRSIRFGKTYHCSTAANIGAENLALPANCTDGADAMSVIQSDGTTMIYKLDTTSGTGRVVRLIPAGSPYYVTSPDVTIDSLKFYVIGAEKYANGDFLQPRVIIVVIGHSGLREDSKSSFTIETTVSQRLFDSQ